MYAFQLTASTNCYIIDHNTFWKIHCFNFFSIQKHSGPNLTCRKIGHGQGHHLSTLGSTRVLDAAYQVSRSCALRFLRRRLLKVFNEAPNEIWLQSALWLLRKRNFKILNLRNSDQGQWMTLTFGIHKASYSFSILHLSTLISYTTTVSEKSMALFYLFPIQ